MKGHDRLLPEGGIKDERNVSPIKNVVLWTFYEEIDCSLSSSGSSRKDEKTWWWRKKWAVQSHRERNENVGACQSKIMSVIDNRRTRYEYGNSSDSNKIIPRSWHLNSWQITAHNWPEKNSLTWSLISTVISQRVLWSSSPLPLS